MTAIPEWFVEADLGLDFIFAGATTRALQSFSMKGITGKSNAPWNNLNLALHVGDVVETVLANRDLINIRLKLPSKPFWLEQVHGTEVVEAASNKTEAVIADASYTKKSAQVLAVMTADCLPVVLASEVGDWISVVHCGWRSLASGILEKALKTAPVKLEKIRAWLGPSIGSQFFEVGEDVRTAFLSQQMSQQLAVEKIEQCFVLNHQGKYLADLPALAKLQLQALGLKWIKGGNFCTFSERQRFFSYRRDGETGRMATLAWIK